MQKTENILEKKKDSNKQGNVKIECSRFILQNSVLKNAKDNILYSYLKAISVIDRSMASVLTVSLKNGHR